MEKKHLRFVEGHPRGEAWLKGRRARQIPFEPFTKGKRENIHEALMQVCNAPLDLED